MANPKGNIKTLKSFKPKWRSGKTQTIRVPIAIADQVLEAARQIDEKYVINTDTSDREELLQAFEEAIAIPSNRGGQMKEAIAKIGKLLDFEIKKVNRNWVITDTSDKKDLEQLFKKAITIPGKQGGQVKKAIAKIGEMLGFEIKKTSKGWAVTDTSE